MRPKKPKKSGDYSAHLDDLERFILWSHVVEGRSIRSIAQDLGL